MVVGLLGRIRNFVHKLHGFLEVSKAEYPLDSDTFSLPSVERAKRLLNFCISKHSHGLPFLPLFQKVDSSVCAGKLQQERRAGAQGTLVVVNTCSGLMG